MNMKGNGIERMRAAACFLLAAVLCIGTGCSHRAPGAVLVTDFGAVPDDGKDDTDALRAAADFVRANPGTTLVFPAGDYLLRDDFAEYVERNSMDGEYGENPEDTLFLPYQKYARGIDFTGSRQATVRGKGARILISGWMEAVTIDQCKDFRLEGLTFEHLRKPLSEGTIISVDETGFTARFDIQPEPFTDRTPFTRVVICDDELDCIYGTDFYFARDNVVDGNTVHFRAKVPERLVGSRLCALHCFHYRPVVHVGESEDVLIRDVTIHDNSGMGITAFHSGNVTMENMSIVPAEGHLFSTNTDATHFASCYGEIVFDHCTFFGEGDDATNVHGYYHDFLSAEGCHAELFMDFSSFTHSQVADVPRPGDTMALIRKKDLTRIGEYRVVESRHEGTDKSFAVTLDRELPEDCSGLYMIDETLMPHLVFRYCSDSRHRARGVLVKTHKGAEIHHNTFSGLSHSGVVLSAEANWKEGWQTEHASIHDNIFTHCGSSGAYKGAAIALDIKCEDDSEVMLHDDVRIFGNTIDANAGNRCALLVRNARNVVIGDNAISGCETDIIHRAAEIVKAGK